MSDNKLGLLEKHLNEGKQDTSFAEGGGNYQTIQKDLDKTKKDNIKVYDDSRQGNEDKYKVNKLSRFTNVLEVIQQKVDDWGDNLYVAGKGLVYSVSVTAKPFGYPRVGNDYESTTGSSTGVKTEKDFPASMKDWATLEPKETKKEPKAAKEIKQEYQQRLDGLFDQKDLEKLQKDGNFVLQLNFNFNMYANKPGDMVAYAQNIINIIKQIEGKIKEEYKNKYEESVKMDLIYPAEKDMKEAEVFMHKVARFIQNNAGNDIYQYFVPCIYIVEL